MQIDTAKLRDIIPDLEFWTGGERRDLDAKIAEACGWTEVMEWFGSGWWGYPKHDKHCRCIIPHYLGTDPAIATEDMQRLVRECGFYFKRDWFDANGWYVTKSVGVVTLEKEGHHLPLAFARAVIAKEDGK